MMCDLSFETLHICSVRFVFKSLNIIVPASHWPVYAHRRLSFSSMAVYWPANVAMVAERV